MRTELVYFPLEPEKLAELEAIARERGITVEELVQAAVTEFLAERRGN